MHRALFTLPLLATTMAFAQAPVQTPTFTLKDPSTLGQPYAALIARVNAMSCPVGMAAEQRASPVTRWTVGDSRYPSRNASSNMWVHVSLKALGNLNLRSAKVEVAYMVPPTGLMLVSSGSPFTRTRTFDIAVDDEPMQELEHSLPIGSGVSITRVKLLSLTYSDGTEWQAGTDYTCSVRISHVLLVPAR